MANLKLRTELLVANLLIISALTGATLLIIRDRVRSEINRQVRDSMSASLPAFESVQRERQLQLSRAAALLAELPTLKAMMTTAHALTIQDASIPFWRLAGSDLFIVASPEGKIYGFHVRKPGWRADIAERNLRHSIEQGEDAAWWYDAGQLYWVFLRPILLPEFLAARQAPSRGPAGEATQLGVIVVGEQVDSSLAQQLSAAAGSQIALVAGHDIIASTVSRDTELELRNLLSSRADEAQQPRVIGSGANEYQTASVVIYDGPPTPIRGYVLVSMEQANNSILELNRTILVLGLSAIGLGALLLSFMSRTITRPLDNLVAGVRALAAGDYAYAITPRGSSEVAEVGQAFAKMRSELLASQQRWMANERTAALGRAASSISHDLRHHLAALVANAEFLYEAEKLKLNKDEIYGEIKTASDQMIELLDSLRELAREERAISAVPSSLEQTMRRAVDAVLTRPEFRTRAIFVRSSGEMEGVFDPKKIERAFFNLLLNACEATPQWQGQIEADLKGARDAFEIRVMDNGGGIPVGIRATLFDPFVSSGKSNGTGLGLAIVNKIVHDHGGSIAVERTSESGTVFVVNFPRFARAETPSAEQTALT
jgi:signal transduction histidine kinase